MSDPLDLSCFTDESLPYALRTYQERERNCRTRERNLRAEADRMASAATAWRRWAELIEREITLRSAREAADTEGSK